MSETPYPHCDHCHPFCCARHYLPCMDCPQLTPLSEGTEFDRPTDREIGS